MFIRRAAIAAAAIAAPLAFAAPATAAPGDMNFSCAPCVGDINGDGTNGPIWNELTTIVPGGAWESGVTAVNGGLQEGLADATDGVPGDGQGAWEKVFPPPPE
jgi:hypothetical protein